MNSNNSVDDTGHTYVENDRDMDLDAGNRMEEETPVSAGTRSMTEREKEARAPPGPSSSKERYRARSRSGSASSASSRASSAATAMAAERKSRREIAQEANRLAMAEARKRENPVIVIASESESTAEEEMGPPAQKDPSRKRKLMAEGDIEDSSDETQRKQGRPQTTGLYVGRAKAIEEFNKVRREASALIDEETLKKMSAGQIFDKIERDLDEAASELSEATTADIAHQMRECMAEVYKVAKCSKNLKGGFIKILKHAAVRGSASAEVLRTRADSVDESDNANDTQKQLRALRRQLAQVKKEAQLAKEEAEKLRKELDELKGKRENRRQRRTYIRDSSHSPPPSPPGVGRKADHAEMTEPVATPTANVEEEPMEVDDTAGGEPQIPEYSDERRKREILPPEKEWPPIWRPPIKGIPKILENGPLIGHKVRLVNDGERPERKGTDTRPGTREKEVGGAQKLMDQLAPLLEKWLRDNLRALGVQATGKDNATPAPPAKPKEKRGDKTKGNPNPPLRSKAPGLPAATERARGSTATPNMTLWSDAAGNRDGDRGTPAPPTYQQIVTRGGVPTNRTETAPTQPEQVAWRTVGKKGKPRKDIPPNKQTPPRDGGKEPRTRPSAQERQRPTTRTTDKGRIPNSNGKVPAYPPTRRPPRSAAVTLTCPPNKYEEAMRIARANINLAELGIDSLRPKRAATGALVLEVPGPNGAEKAIALKERMAEALKEMEGVKVARPIKMADLRVKDLVESSSTEEIKEALAALGQCSGSDIKIGEVRLAPNGLGTIWAQCPLVAANKIAAAGKIRIGGWTTSRVELLEPRQQQCYKCLQRGHMQSNCTDDKNRGDLCYRCSQPGHVAGRCTNTPHCVLCHEQGLASGHRIGGAACKAPRRGARTAKRGKTPADENMEVEVESRPAVRGGPARNSSVGTPVPVRSGTSGNGETAMEAETDPAPSQPPLEKRPPRRVTGGEEPVTEPPKQ